MSYFDYEPELPAGFQDADLEMAELEAAGNRSAELKRKGICDHGWLRGHADYPANKSVICNHCEKAFVDHEAAYAEGRAVRNGDQGLDYRACADCEAYSPINAMVAKSDGRLICQPCDEKVLRSQLEKAQSNLFVQQVTLF